MKIRLGKHHRLNVDKFLDFILILIGILCLFWMVTSYIDILWYQCKGGTSHIWNMLIVFDESLGAK